MQGICEVIHRSQVVLPSPCNIEIHPDQTIFLKRIFSLDAVGSGESQLRRLRLN